MEENENKQFSGNDTELKYEETGTARWELRNITVVFALRKPYFKADFKNVTFSHNYISLRLCGFWIQTTSKPLILYTGEKEEFSHHISVHSLQRTVGELPVRRGALVNVFTCMQYHLY